MSAIGDILTALRTKIDDLGVTGLTVHRRRRVWAVHGNDTLPICVVAPGKETPRDVTFERQRVTDYQVFVGLIYAADGLEESGLDAFLDARQTVRNALDDLNQDEILPAPAPGGTWDYEYEPADFVDGAMLDSNYDYTFWELAFRVTEERIS